MFCIFKKLISPNVKSYTNVPPVWVKGARRTQLVNWAGPAGLAMNGICSETVDIPKILCMWWESNTRPLTLTRTRLPTGSIIATCNLICILLLIVPEKNVSKIFSRYFRHYSHSVDKVSSHVNVFS